MKEFIEDLKSNWDLVVQTGVWLYGIIKTFVIPLPYDFNYATVTTGTDPNLSHQSIAFGKFIVTVLFGLFLLPALHWKKRRYQWRWGGGAL